MKTPKITRRLMAIATITMLMLIIGHSTPAEFKPLVVIGGPLDSVAIQHPVPKYPQTARSLAIEGDVKLVIQVERGEIVKVSLKSGAPMLADYSSRWVRKFWKFKPSVSGQYLLPISYQLQA